jgi:hypothetical protein
MKEIKDDLRKVRSTKELVEYIEKNKNNLSDYDWYFITNSDHFNLKLAPEYAENVDWSSICTFRRDLSESFMRKNAGYLDWYSVSCFQTLTKSFIRDFEDRLSLDKVSGNETLIDKNDIVAFVTELYEKRKNNSKYRNVWKKNLESSIFKPSKKINLTNNFEETKKYTEESISKLSKSEMKKILSEKGIKSYYHDTVEVLKKKILES